MKGGQDFPVSIPPGSLARRITCAALLAVAQGLSAWPAHAADPAEQFALGKRLFTQMAVPACALCHTLKDAGSTGAVGPVLDEIKPDAALVAKALRNGLGNMPAYGATLSEEQIQALAHYVATATGAAR